MGQGCHESIFGYAGIAALQIFVLARKQFLLHAKVQCHVAHEE